MRVTLSLAILASANIVATYAFYFQVNNGDERCFYENLPEKAMLSINYEILNDEARTCLVEVSDASKKTLQSTNLKDLPSHGRLTQVVRDEGIYNVCVQCPGQMWYLSQMAKLSLSLEIADGNDHYGRNTPYELDRENAAKKNEIKELSEELSRFAASIMNINNHQKLETTTAQELHETYKNMYRYILYFYLLQFIIIGVTASMSVYHITKFFKAYRIV
ncbi:hypothetical protein BgAZ_502180 [Babesia gibsoni]|uniref:GOLD domain-containing protein n=1 Tax=Babesia gibsoni TaxID=33632 RepID=A0AAD8PDA8_BABGI|nr:hypothetical protein BgAZ_502180 [Babesia gibsoni]